MVNPHRKALERMWKDRCSIYVQTEKTDPNTNLMHSKTTIPMIAYRIRKGRQVICTEVRYFES